jgi:gliding motility-associated-like protein
MLLSVSTRSSACSPLNVPTVNTATLIGTNLFLNISNTSSWLNCPNVIDVEVACLFASFSGSTTATFTSPPQSFASSPYSYNQMTISIAPLCAGSVYKFRVRERNNNSPVSSLWSSALTFTTPGTFVQPTLILSASPNIICPPATNQLFASVINTCGTMAFTYSWSPSTGLSSTNIANPVATVTSPIVYTCVVTGGATGCWSVSATIALNLGSSPPVPGTAAASPTSVCTGKSVLLSLVSSTGNVQWQSATSSTGPWTDITGATTPTVISPTLPSNTCFRAIVSSCAGNSVTTNTICVTTNPIPVLTSSIGCSNTVALVMMSNFGASGTPTLVNWIPAPIAVNAQSTTATYGYNGPVTVTMSFPDGCVSQSTVNIPTPSLTINTASINCNNLGSATVTPANMTGPFFYNWAPTGQTTSIATGLYPGTYTISVGFNNGNCVHTSATTFNSLLPFTGVISTATSVPCYGVASGTGAITNLTGGTGNNQFLWTNGATSLTTQSVSALTTGVWTVSVTDAITFCSINQVFIVLSPSAMTLNVSASSPTACAGQIINLTSVNSGGTPGSGYTYTWVGGPSTHTYDATQNSGGTYVYTAQSQDANSCLISKTISVTFTPNPVISVSHVSICPLQSGTLIASGASSYTWSNFVTGNTIVGSPLATTEYTVRGTVQTCSSQATASIIVKPLPVPLISSNSPLCNADALLLSGGGGSQYLWTGPGSFLSGVQNPQIPNATPLQSGNYTLKVTAANGCTATATIPVTIHPSPSLSSTGSTVCVNQFLTLNAVSGSAITYTWSGPNGFNSNVQNYSVSNPPVNMSGFYTVVASSAESCTNSSIAHVTVTAMPQPVIASNSPKCQGSVLSLTATGGDSYAWYGPNSFISNLVNPIINNVQLTANGIYTLDAITGPCVARVQHTVTIWALPIPVAQGISVCETKSISLGVISTGSIISYLWNGPFNYTAGTQTTTRDSCKMHFGGIYTITVSDINNCSASDTTLVVIRANPLITTISTTVCIMENALLKAYGADSYVWNGPDGFTSYKSDALIPIAKYPFPTTYTVVGTAPNSCTSVATASVHTLPRPTPTLIAEKERVCFNSTLSLKGYGGTGYSWQGPDNFHMAGQTATFTATNFGMAGIYTLVVSDINNCRNIATVSITIDHLPNGSLTGKMEGCAPFCTELEYRSLMTSEKSSWLMENATRFNQNKFSYCFNTPGKHKIIGNLTDTILNCINEVTVYVQAFEVPQADFTYTPAEPIENFDEILFTDATPGGAEKWSWHLGGVSPVNKQAISTQEIATYIFQDMGTYPLALVVTNKWGCTDTVIKPIIVHPDFHIYVPNAFTPNEDGRNEIFIPVCRGVEKYSLTIFNRWGDKIFHTTDTSEGWDGYYKGLPSPGGIYVWQVNAFSKQGGGKEMKGHFTLYR